MYQNEKLTEAFSVNNGRDFKFLYASVDVK